MKYFNKYINIYVSDLFIMNKSVCHSKGIWYTFLVFFSASFTKGNNYCKILVFADFSLTPYLEFFTPTFGLGTPVFPRISSNLHSGTPTFSRRCLWDSYFQNRSENPVFDCGKICRFFTKRPVHRFSFSQI